MKLAIVRVRGDHRLDKEVCSTFEMLNLRQKNHCVVVEVNPITQGMIQRVASFITWGPVDEKTLAALKKKGEAIFRLNPPRKGYGRKGVKLPFSKGGALGNRKEKITDLLARMM